MMFWAICSSHPDVSAIGWGVTDWYQSHNYRELGKVGMLCLVYSLGAFITMCYLKLHLFYLKLLLSILWTLNIHAFPKATTIHTWKLWRHSYNTMEMIHRNRGNPTFGDDFHSAILWFCTKLTLKLGVISKPWWEFPFLTLVDPYLWISANHVRVRCYQVRGETRILLTSPTPWFSISPKSRFPNRLRTCSNWKDKHR